MVSLKKLSLAVLNLLSVVAGSDKVIVGYFSDWTLADYPTSAVPYELLTHINYAFAIFDDKTWKPTIGSPGILKDLVKKSKPTNTKVLISIGGFKGSKYFSPMAADEESRAAFIKNTVDFVKEYGIDGVDIDWEYPNRDGNEGNYKDPKDVENYKVVLKELKEALPKGTLITAAVRVQPFDGPNGILKDVSAFADFFDFINIMAYDINGPWEPKTGPLGPLENEAGKGPQFSVKSSTSDWNNAGIPKEKLVVGVPFYGYQLGVDEDMSQSDNQYATVTKNSLPSYGFDGLMKNKILSSPTEANESNGWVRKFDKVSKTPWLFNKESKTFISYDDPQSLKYKTDFVRCNGYKGAMIWALNNDYQSTLLKSLQNVHS
ncbi:glycoside hydrolase family 18 protein, partial [Conidiobolus coronatus NRRL 28638]